MVSAGQVWEWLGEVPDPEIPVLSLVDLGVIRDVRFEGDTLVVAVTPTYSGCPATAIINLDIETALRAHGVENLRLERRLSPPWTTDWMSEAGREKLREYGIAPPAGAGAARLPALRLANLAQSQPVRLHALQGALRLRGLPGAVRPFQVHLRMSRFFPLTVTEIRRETRDAVAVTLRPREEDRAAFAFSPANI